MRINYLEDRKFPQLIYNENGVPILQVDGEPFLIIGGELHNSASSNIDFMEKEVWPYIRSFKLNTVILPVAWETIEPEEGEFDFSLLQGILQQARREKVKLILLWFGLWKNGESHYVPSWVKEDTKRFFRAQYRGRIPSNTVSPLCQAGVEADKKAFVKLMEYIRDHDNETHTVIMVQVQNEIGLLKSERDYSEYADQLYGAPVPSDVTDSESEEGNWKAVFGENAAEYFMAYHYARAIENIASAGKDVYPLPMYVNTWLDLHPRRPGIFPTGGPEAKLIPFWKKIAPSLSMIAPDIYGSDFRGICESYKVNDNPLFIPEARRDPVTASNVFYAFGELDALGFSPFGIEDFLKDEFKTVTEEQLAELNIECSAFVCNGTGDYLVRSYKVINGLMPLLIKYRGTDRMRGFIKNNSNETGCIISMGDYDLQLDYMPLRDNKPGSAGIIIKEKNGFYIVGSNVRFTPLPKVGSDSYVTNICLEEGEFVDGVWQKGRVLNGDEVYSMSLGEYAEARYLRLCVNSF